MNYDFVIVADWGTSCLRAFLCKIEPEKTLRVIDSIEGDGVSKINDQFESYLFSKVDHWRQSYEGIPLILSGMIGSSIGWKEAGYLACPLSPASLAESCLTFTAQDHPVYIVPGVSLQKSEHYPDVNYPDVMRGEEIQVLGWLRLNTKYQVGQHLVCLPGTHTKWVIVEDGEIKQFSTAMTGELFDLLSNHSILIKHKSKNFSTKHFIEGVEQIQKTDANNLVNNLFSVRSKQLFNELNEDTAMSYLSGLLIGSDVTSAINSNIERLGTVESVTIIGEKTLSQHFSLALSQLGIESQLCDVTQASLAGYDSLCANLFTEKEVQ